MAKKPKPESEPQSSLFAAGELPPISASAAAHAGLVPWQPLGFTTPASVPPPWELPGWEPRASVPGEPGLNDPPTPEEIARVKKRLRNYQPITRTIHLRDLLGKTEKTKEQKDMAKLREARNKTRKLGDAVRTNIFNDWLDRCVVKVEEPKKWARASDLYASYVRHARKYGPSLKEGETATVTDQMVAREEMSSETGWGRMMAGVHIKHRRAKGNYYPVRLKQGA